MSERNEPGLIDVLIIGGGPAGTGLLLKALKDGARSDFFNRHVALVEQSAQLISGNITQYQVNSDTLSDVFLECLEGETSRFLDVEKLREEIELVRWYKGKPIPLPLLEGYFNKLGELLQEALTAAGKCKFYMNTRVEKVAQNKDNSYTVYLSGGRRQIKAMQIVLATGGVSKTLSGTDEIFAGAVALSAYADKIIHSDALLRYGLSIDAQTAMMNKPKVVVLGGSHSAFSAGHYLLSSTSGIPFAEGDIQIWSTKQPKIYFNNKDEAVASGYRDFGEEDFCPVTGKLYRLAGLRMDGRALYMQMLGVGGAAKEKRVAHHVYTNQVRALEEQLKAATLIVLAYGYRLNMMPFLDADGREMHFRGSETNHWVNDNCELLDGDGRVVPNLFATGLATGFIPRGALGGEPSFEGQTNGIWYYQNAIADLIMRRMG